MVVQTNDLCCKTGCICFLISFYWKIPDCLGCDGLTSCLCWQNTCRTGFPTSLCTIVGQCCCLDLRCAIPCDPTNVPMTIGILGLICCDFQRGGCGKYGAINCYKLCPCFSKGIFGDDKKFGLEEAPLKFSMGERKEVFLKDSSGHYCIVKPATQEEIDRFKSPDQVDQFDSIKEQPGSNNQKVIPSG